MKRFAIALVSLALAAWCHGQSQDFFGCVQSGRTDQVEAMLRADPLLVNTLDRAGRTPLFIAVSAGNTAMARLLIDNGALVRVGDANLRAPIHFANWSGDKEAIDLLLEKGAVIDTRAIGAATPLIHSSLSDNFDMSRFLIERGAEIDIQCNSLTTPLYFAVLNDNRGYFRYLVEAGADVDIPDFLDRTPLAIAVRDGNLALAEALIAAGADPSSKDKHLGRSLLHLAAIEGHADVCDLLVRAGLKADEKDRSGSTPLDYARRYGHLGAARLLAPDEAAVKEGRPGQAVPNPRVLAPKAGEAEIVKLQNGSWAVQTRSAFLVLGYSEIGAAPPERSLVNGHVTPEVVAEAFGRGQAVYYVDREFHRAGHPFSLQGANPFFAFQKADERIAFIANPAYDRMYAGLGLKNVHYPRGDEPTAAGVLTCRAFPSYGNHSCLVIEADGLTIVWLTGVSDNYLVQRRDASVIDRLASAGVKPDLLFLGTPSGIGPEIGNGIREAYLEARRLEPGAVFAFGHEPLERRVLGQIRRRVGGAGEFHCADNPGDSFIWRTNGLIPRTADR
jgi:ankyrin repeat protein